VTQLPNLKFEELSEKLDLKISRKKLREAFLHSSYIGELQDEEVRSNERLEFLGDAVIDLAINHYLIENFENLSEGELTKIKSVVVSGPVLAERARKLELGKYLLLGRGEEESGGRKRTSILGDTFEALVGAIFINKGYKKAKQFVINNLSEEIKLVTNKQHRRDYKSLLQEETQARFGIKPIYTILKEEGADHRKEFTVEVKIKQAEIQAKGRGRNKKEAEQAAAKQAYLKLQDQSSLTKK
jgi:ribonuclease-3